MSAGGSAHPGTDTRPVHAGIVMRCMLKFMGDGIAGCRGSEDHDRDG